jgi:nucleoside-diphosphate-sugar epimerase
MMRTFPSTQRISLGHHVDVAQAVHLVLAPASLANRIYNVCDDEAPDIGMLFAACGQPPPDGTEPERARPFESVMDGRRIRDELGFRPRFPRLADALPS